MLPKSTSPERIAANLAVGTWRVAAEDVETLSNMPYQVRGAEDRQAAAVRVVWGTQPRRPLLVWPWFKAMAPVGGLLTDSGWCVYCMPDTPGCKQFCKRGAGVRWTTPCMLSCLQGSLQSNPRWWLACNVSTLTPLLLHAARGVLYCAEAHG